MTGGERGVGGNFHVHPTFVILVTFCEMLGFSFCVRCENSISFTLRKNRRGQAHIAPRFRITSREVIIMLRWALMFLVVALVAALFGFTGIAVAAAGIAKFLFGLFLVLCLIFLIMGISVGRKVS